MSMQNLGIKQKSYKPAKLKTLKGNLGKNGIPLDKRIKTSTQKLGIKAFDYILKLSFEHILTLSLTSDDIRSVQSSSTKEKY